MLTWLLVILLNQWPAWKESKRCGGRGGPRLVCRSYSWRLPNATGSVEWYPWSWSLDQSSRGFGCVYIIMHVECWCAIIIMILLNFGKAWNGSSLESLCFPCVKVYFLCVEETDVFTTTLYRQRCFLWFFVTCLLTSYTLSVQPVFTHLMWRGLFWVSLLLSNQWFSNRQNCSKVETQF